jgi:hypothetical protein
LAAHAGCQISLTNSAWFTLTVQAAGSPVSWHHGKFASSAVV